MNGTVSKRERGLTDRGQVPATDKTRAMFALNRPRRTRAKPSLLSGRWPSPITPIGQLVSLRPHWRVWLGSRWSSSRAMHKRPPYTSNTLQISFDFTGSSISLAAGTNITPNVTNFSMKYPAPPVDFGGFPLGSTSFTLTSLAIGTDAQGNIVTWDVVGDQFAFYPETPTGNQNAFSCEYKTAFAPTGGSGSLVADQDLGVCPFATISEAANGLWPVQQIAQTPGHHSGAE